MKNACTKNGLISKKTSAIATARDSKISANHFASADFCLSNMYLRPTRTRHVIMTVG